MYPNIDALNGKTVVYNNQEYRVGSVFSCHMGSGVQLHKDDSTVFVPPKEFTDGLNSGSISVLSNVIEINVNSSKKSMGK
jgi:hypothetical protein